MRIDQYKTLEEKKGVFQDYQQIKNMESFNSWYDTIINNDGSIFRGINDASFKNYTSAHRHNIISDYEDLPHQTQIKLELDELRKVNDHLLEKYCANMHIPCSDLFLLSFAQHYGGISPLLDFTKDIDIALFFMTDGVKFPSSGAGDYPCEDISNYCSLYYYKNDEIERTTSFLETTAISDPTEIIEEPKVIGISPVLQFAFKTGHDISTVESFLSYDMMCNVVYTPPTVNGTIRPLLIENEPIVLQFQGKINVIQLIISNLNIESQKGCFIFLTHYDYPLENGLRCVDIHKSLVPYITKKVLSPKGINKESMYPDERSIVKKAFTDSLTREDWLDYYHM